MKRKMISILILFALTMSLLPLSGCGKSGDESSITRGEWIVMLSKAFGMDSYIGETPYYEDISSASQLFPYVQSSAEWNVLAIFSDAQLKPDAKITREEVGSTAAIAAGYAVSEEQYDSEGNFDAALSIEYAVQCGILENSSRLSKAASLEECERAITAARTAYLNLPIAEKMVVDLSDDIVDLTALNSDQYTQENGQLAISNVPFARTADDKVSFDTGTGNITIGVGDIFLTASTAEKPTGVAYKVAAIDEKGDELIITTEEPSLYDLYDQLDVSTTVSVDSDNIIWLTGAGESSGVQSIVSNSNNEFYVSFLSASMEVPHMARLGGKTYNYGGYSNHFEIGNGSFESKWSNHNSSVIGSGEGAQALSNSNFVYDMTPSIDDFNGSTDSWSKPLKVDNSISGGYKITGDIAINALTVTTSIEYNKLWGIPYGVKSASIQVNSDISSSLKLEGNLNERLHIATIPVPIAATGLSVCVDLYLFADANGSLVVTASLGSAAKVEYYDKKLKHTASSQADAKVDANIDVDFGAELAATLDACGIVKIVDVGARVGGVLSASAGVSGSCKVSEENKVAKLTYHEALHFNADLYVPTVNLYAGGTKTLIGTLGLSGSWDIITKENGAKHYSLADYEWVFWEETVLTDENGEIIASDSTDAGKEDGVGASNEKYLDLKTYVLTLTGESVRLELDSRAGEAIPDVVWTSDDPSVASVDNTGLVTPVSTGYTIITVTLRSNPDIYAKCAVYVEEIGENNWEFLPSDMAVVILNEEECERLWL